MATETTRVKDIPTTATTAAADDYVLLDGATNGTRKGLASNLIGAGTSSFDGAYASLTGIPSTFTPAAHNQAWSTITTTPTTLSGYGITDAQGLDSDLTALAGLSTTGLVARTGSGTAATRTITGTANQVIVANGDGVAGNPTLSLPQSIAPTSTPQFAGAYVSGNVGIGTNAPGGVLDVAKPSGGRVQVLSEGANTYNVIASRNAADSAYLPLTVKTSVISLVAVDGVAVSNNLNTGGDLVSATGVRYNNGSIHNVLGTDGTGAIVGTISNQYLSLWTNSVPRATLSTTGALRLHNYGAGSLVTDSSGNVTASSDARLKNVSGKFTRGLDAILQIQPKVFTWKPESGMNTDDVNVGFIAQDVQPAIPEAVGSMKTSDVEEVDGTGKKVKKSKREASEFLSLSDRPIIAALVNAVKELSEQNAALVKRITTLEMAKK